jgi:hypothetical protein
MDDTLFETAFQRVALGFVGAVSLDLVLILMHNPFKHGDPVACHVNSIPWPAPFAVNAFQNR